MQILTAPDEKKFDLPSLFLAGGISNCGDWQSEMIALLAIPDLVLLNPRRDRFDMSDPTVSEAQIAWEYRYLRQATAVLFWFPPETLCPITLFELGGALERSAPVFVGCHTDYARQSDVRVQISLARPEIRVVSVLADLAKQIQEWGTSKKAGREPLTARSPL
ncbi:MAG: nucleoside 2-deoxyribosyltransferase domain-containing protein [Fibrella sp.]|nr:nucleoside 2-deoxyribosyltransferase domain-containing protein [Armatimonadota bacterium]